MSRRRIVDRPGVYVLGMTEESTGRSGIAIVVAEDRADAFARLHARRVAGLCVGCGHVPGTCDACHWCRSEAN